MEKMRTWLNSENRKLLGLRVKYLFLMLAVFVFITALLAIYNYFDEEFNFAKIFEFKIHNDIMEHDFIFPALNKNLLSGLLVFLGVVVGWIVCYQIYHKYKYEAEKIKDSSLPQKKISWKSFFKALGFICVYQIFFFFGDEIVFGLEECLNGKTKLGLVILIGLVVFISVFINNIGDLCEKHLMNSMKLQEVKIETNKKDKKEEKLSFFQSIKKNLSGNKKYYGFKLLAIFGTSFLMLAGAYLVGKLPEWIPALEKIAEFKITIPCYGDTITIFNNEKNIFFLMWLEFAIFLLLYKAFLPAIEKRYDKDYKAPAQKGEPNGLWGKIENSLAFKTSSAILGTFIAAIVGDVSLNVSNSFQSLSNNIASYLICMAFITVAGLILVGYNVRNFILEEASSLPVGHEIM